jgi:hypothetical protein
MNMLAKKISPAANERDALAALDRRLGELQARRDELTESIILAEKSAAASDHQRSDLTQAEALLAGKPFVASREKPLSGLAALHAERSVIDAALKIGQSRRDALATELAVGIWASYQTEIAQIEMRRVTLALQLQATNHARERLREKIIAEGGEGCLSSDGVDLLGLGERHDDVQWAAARLVADGICSRREIEKIFANG